MRFAGIIGNPGSGKTTFMTAVLHSDHLEGEKIVANYALKFPFTIMRFDEMAEMPANIKGATVGMDELGKGADSYQFFSGRATKLATLVSQSRKFHCTMYFTVQRFGLIAARLRALTDRFYLMQDLDERIPHCKCTKLPCTCGADSYKCAMYFRVTTCDENERPIAHQLFNGNPYKSLFNTDEVIW